MALQRYYPKFKHRTVSFYDPYSGGFYSETSGVKQLGHKSTLVDALHTVDTPILMLMPDKAGKYPKQDIYSEIDGVTDLKYLSKRSTAKLKYEKKYVNIYPISLWFDVAPKQPLAEVIRAYRKLKDLLNENFQPEKVHNGKAEPIAVELLATPSQTGQNLLKVSLPFEKQYEPVPKEEALIIMENFGQGRFEVFYHGQDTLEKAYNYDGRWFYAACVRGVPTGTMTHDFINEVGMTPPSKTGTRGYIPGFYHVVMQVPTIWQHIGLLPVREKDRTYYPRQPGLNVDSWCTSCELSLALENNWHLVKIHERILWSEQSSDPLHLFTERLKRIRMQQAETLPEPQKSYIKGAIRNILLQTLGSFRHVAAEKDFYVSTIEELPEYYRDLEMITYQKYRYTVQESITSYQKDLCQVHWISWLWGFARRKLAVAALQVPFNDIVALRADAIWTKNKANFIDTGNVGQFKLEHLIQDTDFSWPLNNADMRRLVITAKGHDTDTASNEDEE
jgi:hypothetical protein